MSENPVFHDKSKHIEIKYHYIRDMVQRGVVKLQYVATDKHIAVLLLQLFSPNLLNFGPLLITDMEGTNPLTMT